MITKADKNKDLSEALDKIGSAMNVIEVLFAGVPLPREVR